MRPYNFMAVLIILHSGWAVEAVRTWNNLKTTFARDGIFSWLYDTKGYKPVPRTVKEALGNDWVLRSDDCRNGGQYFGLRYTYQNDRSVAALFDKNGVIVGLQMNIKVTDAHANQSTYKYEDVAMFQKNIFMGDEMYTLTAYFTNPARICTTGRVPNALVVEGTGTRLSFQNGPTPLVDLINVPKNRKQALIEGWSDNRCFVGMGVHNWYKQEVFQNDNCNTIRPVFLLYDVRNELIGWGFQHIGKSIAPRFEQPGSFTVQMIVGDNVSPCLLDRAANIGVTTMHVFLINNPLSQNCVI